jgi:predicted site-specific integrase-resolvase
MQPSQVKEHFGAIDLRIDRAAQLCQTSTDVPEQLRESLSELSREADQALQMLATEKNDNRIIQCVDRLEKLGDRALHACAQAGNTMNEQVQAAVKEAHDAISDLKHRLH